jgi:hypothetical protein
MILAAMACTFPFGAGIRGSGDITTIHEDVADFDRVEVHTAFEVTITQGDSYSLVIRIDDNLERYLEVDQAGDNLSIGLESGRSYSNLTAEADITMPALSELELSGASEAKISGFRSTDSFKLSASGASRAEGEIRTGDLNIQLSGASRADLVGEGGDLVLQASGASDADLQDFPINNADVELSGASRATVNISGILDLNASGASKLEYLGDPRLGDIETSGASTIERK